MKKIGLIAIIVLLVGCQSTPIHHYRPKGSDNLWMISGNYNELTGSMVVSINGTKYPGQISPLTGSGSYTFQHEGHPGAVDCAEAYGMNLYPQQRCHVFIDGERAALLQF